MASAHSRRRFLLALGATGLAAGCSSAQPEATTGPELVNLFSPDRVIAAGSVQRIPFAVVDNGAVDLDDHAELAVTVRRGDETIAQLTVAGRIVDHDHVGADNDPDHQHADLLRYFALRTELPDPGVYDVEVDFGDGVIGQLPVQAFDRSEVGLVLPGEAMPSLTTPTVTDPTGIDPLCTRSPEPCPFHQISLDAALAQERPVALLVATPALCATAYCGPVLETLMAAAPDHDGIAMIHQEVYANAASVDGNYADPDIELAEPLRGLGLEFEPSLFLVDTAGIVVDRIDNIFDRAELDAALATLA